MELNKIRDITLSRGIIVYPTKQKDKRKSLRARVKKSQRRQGKTYFPNAYISNPVAKQINFSELRTDINLLNSQNKFNLQVKHPTDVQLRRRIAFRESS